MTENTEKENSQLATCKKWYQSKTIRLGIAAVVIAVATSLADEFDYKSAIIAALGAIGVYLRSITTKGVSK